MSQRDKETPLQLLWQRLQRHLRPQASCTHAHRYIRTPIFTHRNAQSRMAEQHVTAFSPPPCRGPSLQMYPLWEGLHPALLTWVPYEEDPQRHPDVCLQGAPQQAVRVRGVWPHVSVSGWSACAPALASSQQSPAEGEDGQEDRRRRKTCFNLSTRVSTERWKWHFQWINRAVEEWITRMTTALMNPGLGGGAGIRMKEGWDGDEAIQERWWTLMWMYVCECVFVPLWVWEIMCQICLTNIYFYWNCNMVEVIDTSFTCTIYPYF